MSRFFGWFVIMILYVVVGSLRSAKKSTGGSSAKAATSGSAASARTHAPSALKRRRAKDEDCEYGEINHEYSHVSDRRVAQLDGYLKAGLIDKKEYAQMLERYRRQDQAYENTGN